MDHLRYNQDIREFCQQSANARTNRQAVRKFSQQFIRRRLRLVYSPVGKTVLTDEKWLLFVIEQVISNAVKYTPSGEVEIYCEEPMTLYRTFRGADPDASALLRARGLK